MSRYPRYAIYFVPAAGSEIYRFGASLLGYDAFSGGALPFPEDLTADVPGWHELTQGPRTYGFHATLKAPFSLAAGKIEDGLILAFESFVKTRRPVPVIVPVIELICGFIALVPAQPIASLTGLAADCVEYFDPFRAPLTAEDRARRNPSKLTARQVESLDRWGSPYVGDEFRFHMTLTGRIPDGRSAGLLRAITDRFSAVKLDRLQIGRIAISRQDEAGANFRVLTQGDLSPG
jgi:putative phosphonate metabolism protein